MLDGLFLTHEIEHNAQVVMRSLFFIWIIGTTTIGGICYIKLLTASSGGDSATASRPLPANGSSATFERKSGVAGFEKFNRGKALATNFGERWCILPAFRLSLKTDRQIMSVPATGRRYHRQAATSMRSRFAAPAIYLRYGSAGQSATVKPNTNTALTVMKMGRQRC